MHKSKTKISKIKNKKSPIGKTIDNHFIHKVRDNPMQKIATSHVFSSTSNCIKFQNSKLNKFKKKTLKPKIQSFHEFINNPYYNSPPIISR